LYAALHTHPASMCPLNTAEGKKMLRELFSDENIRKSGVKMVSANMSCPIEGPPIHKGYFILDASDVPTVEKYFGPMSVEVREVKPLSEVAKILESSE
jgi:hypothetical protein